MRDIRPCVIEWRLTTDVNPSTNGLHTYYPWGVQQSFTMQGQVVELRISGDEVYDLQVRWDDGWDEYVKITYMQGIPAFRFIRPTEVSDEFKMYEWYDHGKTYILEIRIKQLL